MNKLYKILTIVTIMVIIIVASIFVQVQAFEYTNDGVIKYVTSAHEMNGVTLQLTTPNALSLKGYFLDHPVTDEKAREIIDNLELARKTLEDAGVKTTSEVRAIPGLQDKITDYIEKACEAADLTLIIDTTKAPLEVAIKHNADNIITQTSYFDIFGSNNLDDPDDPNKPVDPDDPNKPVDPDDPNKPDDPDDPNKPVDPDDPNKPVNPDDSNKPVNPSKPDNNNGNTGSNGSNGSNSGSTAGSSNTGTVSKTSTAKKLVYTGNDFSLAIRIIVAIVAVAILGIAVKKYAK